MPQRNGPRSSRGRSAVARKVKFGGPSPTNGMMPSVLVLPFGATRPIRTSYFGGPIKGGAAPSVGWSRAAPYQITANAGRSNFLFKFQTSYGPRPFGPYIVS